MKYKCINSFSVDKYDDDGFCIENEYQEIELGSEWALGSSTIISGEVHLDSVSNNNHMWLEVSKERFNKYFELII